KHPTTGNAIASPYVSMSQQYMKQVNQIWYQFYQVVKENCSVEWQGSTPQDDVMERLLRARGGLWWEPERRQNAKEEKQTKTGLETAKAFIPFWEHRITVQVSGRRMTTMTRSQRPWSFCTMKKDLPLLFGNAPAEKGIWRRYWKSTDTM